MKSFLPLTFLVLFFASSLVSNAAPVLEHHLWWTNDELHLLLTASENLPSSKRQHVSYFLSFKNTWLIETEGLINHFLKEHSLQVAAFDGGDSSFEGRHHFTAHVVLKKVKPVKRHKECKLMAFVYTSDSQSKDLVDMCSQKIDIEAPKFRSEWRELGQFSGGIESGKRGAWIRSFWRGLLGVKS